MALDGAWGDHNVYNTTLVRLRNDDAANDRRAACAKARRVPAAGQQSFLTRIASDQFAHTLGTAPAASWQLPVAASGLLYGQTVTLSGDRAG